MVDWLSGRVVEWPRVKWLSGLLVEWLSGRVVEWLSGRVAEWLSDQHSLVPWLAIPSRVKCATPNHSLRNFFPFSVAVLYFNSQGPLHF